MIALLGRLAKKQAQWLIVWGLEEACSALDSIPRIGYGYEVHPDFGTGTLPPEEYIRSTGRLKFYRRGGWGCGTLGGKLAIWSCRLDVRWHTGQWRVP